MGCPLFAAYLRLSLHNLKGSGELLVRKGLGGSRLDQTGEDRVRRNDRYTISLNRRVSFVFALSIMKAT